jgi:hypothetical protein
MRRFDGNRKAGVGISLVRIEVTRRNAGQLFEKRRAARSGTHRAGGPPSPYLAARHNSDPVIVRKCEGQTKAAFSHSNGSDSISDERHVPSQRGSLFQAGAYAAAAARWACSLGCGAHAPWRHNGQAAGAHPYCRCQPDHSVRAAVSRDAGMRKPRAPAPEPSGDRTPRASLNVRTAILIRQENRKVVVLFRSGPGRHSVGVRSMGRRTLQAPCGSSRDLGRQPSQAAPFSCSRWWPVSSQASAPLHTWNSLAG